MSNVACHSDDLTQSRGGEVIELVLGDHVEGGNTVKMWSSYDTVKLLQNIHNEHNIHVRQRL